MNNIPSELFDLVPTDIFFLAACQVYQDGQVDSKETVLLLKLRELLGIDRDSAGDAIDRARSLEHPLGGPVEVETLFEQCCRLACLDGVLTLKEEDLLQGLAGVLGLSASEATYKLEAFRA